MRLLVKIRNGLAVVALLVTMAVAWLGLSTLNRYESLKANFSSLVSQVNLPSTARVTEIYANDYDPATGEGTLLAKLYVQNREHVAITQVPDQVKSVFLATEDTKFYQHDGIDYWAVVRAMKSNLTAGEIREGASTITMQLARNIFLPYRKYEKTYERKLIEALLALAIERRYSKQEILENYLNFIYFGESSYGVKTAAKTYFDKSLDELNLAQTALLAGLPQRPSAYNPFENPERAKQRRNLVLNRLLAEKELALKGKSPLELSAISVEQIEAAKDQPLGLAEQSPESGSYYRAPFFVDHVKQRLTEIYSEEMVYSQGLTVSTTLDPELHKKAREIVRERINEVMEEKNVHQGALVSMDNSDGAIRAMVGGMSWEESKFNRVTQMERQPGSSFKPFLYATALKMGWRLDDWVVDTEEKTYETLQGEEWSPNNANWKYHGQVPLAWAMIRSKNAASGWLINQIGPKHVVRTAKQMGISTDLVPVMSLALGTEEVKPIDMATAFTTFANAGTRVEPYAVKRVYDPGGQLIDDFTKTAQRRRKQSLDPEIAAKIRAIMQAVVRYGTGTRARLEQHHSAGKTGTTEDYRDAWFNGYTPHLTTAVWIGNDQPKNAMKRMYGGQTPAVIWHDFMEFAHKEKEVKPFPPPPSGRSYSIPAWETKPAPEEEEEKPEKSGEEKDTSPPIPEPDREVYF